MPARTSPMNAATPARVPRRADQPRRSRRVSQPAEVAARPTADLAAGSAPGRGTLAACLPAGAGAI